MIVTTTPDFQNNQKLPSRLENDQTQLSLNSKSLLVLVYNLGSKIAKQVTECFLISFFSLLN